MVLARAAWGPAAPPTWTPEGAPLLELGAEEPGSPELFGRVSEARFGPGGTLWVVDALIPEVRIFHARSGDFQAAFGSRGEGPGAFMQVEMLGFDEESAWFWDPRLGRTTQVSLEGEPLAVEPMGQDRDLIPRLLSRTGSGDFLSVLPQLAQGPLRVGEVLQDTVRIWEVGKNAESPRLLAEQPGARFLLTAQGGIPIPFTDGGRFAARGDRLVLSHPEGQPQLRVFDGGRLTLRIETEIPRTPARPDDRREALQRLGFGDSPPDGMSIPSLLPSWGFLKVGADGSILALRTPRASDPEPGNGDPSVEVRSPWAWDVFTPEGRHLGLLLLPPNAQLLDYGETGILMVRTPVGEGPRVHLHPLPGWE